MAPSATIIMFSLFLSARFWRSIEANAFQNMTENVLHCQKLDPVMEDNQRSPSDKPLCVCKGEVTHEKGN